jgi:hypothetical protein
MMGGGLGLGIFVLAIATFLQRPSAPLVLGHGAKDREDELADPIAAHVAAEVKRSRSSCTRLIRDRAATSAASNGSGAREG